MSYHIATSVSLPFDEAVGAAEAALAEEGFGIISQIDIQASLKARIGVDLRPYTVLGACNPKLAYEALQSEDKVGTLLPCNVVVQEVGSGHTRSRRHRSRCLHAGYREHPVGVCGERGSGLAAAGNRQPRATSRDIAPLAIPLGLPKLAYLNGAPHEQD
jgi:uncharacterized protein (DUF302 family)